MVAVEPLPPMDSTDLLTTQSTGDDHPDPVTLTEPEHDEQGLLRWGSVGDTNRP